MTFASPSVLLLLALLLPAILALHTLRREERSTASLFLWKRVASSRRGARKRRSVPWRKPILWLHLAIATLAVLALADPRRGASESTDHVVLLLDGSRTMRTADVEPSRFDAAISWAVETWGRTNGDALVSVLLVSDEVDLLAARQRSGQDVADVLTSIEAEDTAPAWQDAITLAGSLVRPDEVSRLLLVTDGATNESIEIALQEPYDTAQVDVERFEIGGPFVNVGLANVAVQRHGTVAGRWTVSGEVRSTGLQRGDIVRVQVFFRPEGSQTSLPWTGLDVAIGRDGRGSIDLPVDLPGDGILEVRTTGRDQRPSDDVARRVLTAGSAVTRVALVGPDDPAMLEALRAVGDVDVVSFDEVPDPEISASFHLVIMTRASNRPIDTSVFWYGSAPETFVAKVEREMTEPLTAAPAHPLMQDVDARELGIRSSSVLELPEGAEPMIVMDGAVLAWSRTTDAGRQVAFGFGPEASVWASQVSFPVFAASLVQWARSTATTDVAACLVGDPCPLPTAAFAGDWELIGSDGETVARAPILKPAEDAFAQRVWSRGAFDRAFEPKRAGLYELRFGDGTSHWLAVDAPTESAPERPSTGEAAAIRDLPNDVAGVDGMWRWLAGVVAVLLGVDAFLAWRSMRASLSARSRSGQASARRPLALLATATLFVVAAAVLVPSLRWTAGATKVALLPASLERDEPATFSDRVRDRVLGWRSIDIRVGTRASGEDPTEATWPMATTLGQGIDLAVALHRGQGPLVVDARDVRVRDVTAKEAADLLREVDATSEAVAVWPSAVASATRPGRDASTIERVDVPLTPRAGGAFELVATLDPSDRPTVLDVLDETERLVASQPLPADLERARLTLQAEDAGWATYTLRLRDGRSDGSVLETATVVVNVADPLAALVVASRDEAGARLLDALDAQRIDVERVAPDRIPATLERLEAYDVVFLVDVPASEVHPFHQEMLQRFVRDEGGGLVIVGGSRSFGPGGYYSTLLDDVSPLSSRIEEDTPEVSMTFVLDRSGSMNAAEGTSTRMELAKLATFEAIRLLGERSQAALVVFDSEATTLLPLRSTADLEPFRSALRSVIAGGGTSIYPALAQAHDVVAASDAATRHVIVMTDGLSEEGDFETILARIGALGVGTSFVGVGDAASRGQLTRLAGYGGGSLHFTNDARALPGILAQEALMLSADPIEERTTRPVWVGGAPPAFLGEGADTTIATFLGYVKTTAKDEATVIVEDAASQDPLLATWRYGVGRVAAFASEADGPWSGAWTQQEDFGTFWSQLARWSAMTVPGDPFRLDVSVRETVVDVLLDVAPDRDPRYPPVVQLVAAATDRVVTGTVMGREATGRWTARLGLPDVDGAPYLVRVLPAAGDALREPIEFAFVHRPDARSGGSSIDVVPLETLSENLAVGNAAGGSRLFEPGRLRTVVPDVAWRGSPRIWLAAAVVAFMLALLIRFGGLSLRRSRSS